MSGIMMETPFLLGILKACLFITIIISFSFSVSALIISEVESNPEGTDSNFEWVELYSETEINLEGYYIENNDGDRFDLTGRKSGYIVIDLPGQWLDNSDEKVILKRGTDTVDSTIIFKDDKNNDETFNFCNGNWEVLEESKGEPNNCEITSENVGQIEEEDIQSDESKDRNSLSDTTSKKERQSFFANEYYIRKAMIYAFVAFCILVAIIIMLRRESKTLKDPIP